jgi:hypothetical protein
MPRQDGNTSENERCKEERNKGSVAFPEKKFEPNICAKQWGEENV